MNEIKSHGECFNTNSYLKWWVGKHLQQSGLITLINKQFLDNCLIIGDGK